MPPPLANEPIGVQMQRVEPRLAGLPFRVLLDFERESDLAFMRSSDAKRSTQRAHTGFHSLALAGGGVEVSLASLGAGQLPGTWTLLGGYVYANDPGTVTIQSQASQRTVALAPGKWTPVFVDLTTAGPGLDRLKLAFSTPAFVDDVVLINNASTLESPASVQSGWTIQRGGLNITVDRPGRFKVTLPLPESAAAETWNVEETNPLRARFKSTGGKTWTLYPDGRQYLDGQFSWLGPALRITPIYQAQHISPGELDIDSEIGWVARETAGDRLNDGYNELRGAYQLGVRGQRFSFTISPKSKPIARPVIEITGVKKGTPMITAEGQLVETFTWLTDDRLLVELPIAVERTVKVEVGIK